MLVVLLLVLLLVLLTVVPAAECCFSKCLKVYQHAANVLSQRKIQRYTLPIVFVLSVLPSSQTYEH
jgi:hypothetical protein